MYKPSKNNLELLRSLQETINELLEPLEFAVWRMKLRNDAPSALRLFANDLQMIAARFLIASDSVTHQEARGASDAVPRPGRTALSKCYRKPEPRSSGVWVPMVPTVFVI